MYKLENSIRREGRSRHETRESPSFSSTLLDKIYRSIDDDENRTQDLKFLRDTITKKKQTTNNRGLKNDDEEQTLSSFRRACLIEKWMEKKIEETTKSQRRRENRNNQNDMNDPLFFSSTSSSSDSSSGGFSSSDTESIFGAARSASWPKPVRTTLPEKKSQRNDVVVKSIDDETLIKSKSRALKIYNNLKKVKQPISPGGRLASFINNLFASSNVPKKPNARKASETTSFHEPSTRNCSSASSFSRSCLSKSSPSSRGKRSVRFYPVSVIVDEDSRPCGHKSLHADEQREAVLVPVSVPTAWKIGRRSPARKADEAELKAREFLRDYRQNQIKNELIIMRDQFRGKEGTVDHGDGGDDDDGDGDGDDTASYSSSDLFELDHLAVFGKEVRYKEELPVYETTRVDRNRVIF